MTNRVCHDDDDVELHVLGCRVDILGTNCDQCLSMVQCCFTSTETVRLIRMESPGRPPRLSHSSWTLTCLSPPPSQFVLTVRQVTWRCRWDLWDRCPLRCTTDRHSGPRLSEAAPATPPATLQPACGSSWSWWSRNCSLLWLGRRSPWKHPVTNQCRSPWKHPVTN